MKIAVATDPGVPATAVAVTAAASGASWLSMAKDVALELFGVPLPVVLACAAAAYLALSFRADLTYLRTLFLGVGWTFVGSCGAQLALVLLGKSAGIEMPAGALAAAGMLVAGGGPLVMTRQNVEKLGAAVGRVIDGFRKGSQL